MAAETTLSREQRNQLLMRETAKLFGLLFVGRRTAKAIYTPNGWIAKREPFTLKDFEQHLFGQRCLGTYLLNEQSMVRCMVFDIDLLKSGPYVEITDAPSLADYAGDSDLEVHHGNLEAALHDPTHPAHRWVGSLVLSTVTWLMQETYNALGLTATPIVTGGGAHVFVPFGHDTPAAEARSMAQTVMDELPHFSQRSGNFYTNAIDPASSSVEIEIFPKQSELPDPESLGNLIRLPFGWHTEAGVRTYALDPRLPQFPSWELKRSSSIDALRLQAAALDLEWKVNEEI